MSILSIQVGTPRSVRHGGRTVRTAIFKDPVLFRVFVRRLNVEGDAQADLRVHGGPDKAVYAYDLGGYEHWRQELGLDLPFGQFGENLTVAGMPETQTRIGDVYRIGGAVLQVSQPRSPCFKLAMKMGRPQFLKEFLVSGRTGFYLRVLEEGEIGPGDAITLLSRQPDSATVAQTTRQTFGPAPQRLARN
ncbi:MAG: MOSC domain-containing protein [Acidobacteriota bacterium]